MIKKNIIIGASGHSKVIIDNLRSTEQSIDFLLDDNSQLHGAELSKIPILGDINVSQTLDTHNTHFIVGIGSNSIRQNIYEIFVKKGFNSFNAIHSSVVISTYSEIGLGVAIMPNVVVNAGTKIGNNVILNTACTIDHDCIISAHSHIAPGVHVCGGVIIGEGALIGVGASILPNIKIGKNVTIAAGAVVIKDIPDMKTVKGVPAR